MRRPGWYPGAWSVWHLQLVSLHPKSWISWSDSFACVLFFLLSERSGRGSRPRSEAPCTYIVIGSLTMIQGRRTCRRHFSTVFARTTRPRPRARRHDRTAVCTQFSFALGVFLSYYDCSHAAFNCAEGLHYPERRGRQRRQIRTARRTVALVENIRIGSNVCLVGKARPRMTGLA